MFIGAIPFAGQDALVANVITLGIALLLLYLWLRGTVPPNTYSAKLAWLRAGMYFCICILVANDIGVLATVGNAPLALPGQLADPLWWLLTLACTAVVVVGYVVIWPKGTFTDGRTRHPILALVYGGTWGICQGLMFLSIWALIERTSVGVAWVAAISYAAIAVFNGSLHRFFWDIYVSPPHNYSDWNARKVLLCHTPNLLTCLSYLALYGNAGIFVLLQAVALAASAWFMRFPAWWDDYTAVPGKEKNGAETVFAPR